jgi:hypothetical protein
VDDAIERILVLAAETGQVWEEVGNAQVTTSGADAPP